MIFYFSPCAMRYASWMASKETKLTLKECNEMKETMKGRVLAVNISEKKGTKKNNVQRCVLLKDFGLKDDAHAGPWHRQVSLLANESIEKMRAMGLKVGYGDFAENITTESIDLVHLPIGTEIRIGNSVLLRVTQIGKECHTRCAIYYQAGDCVMPKEGIFAEVVSEGEVKVGDEIIIEKFEARNSKYETISKS
jgi:MOSC domain-containing protein YiiM